MAEGRRRRPVAARVLASFAVVVVAFAAASGFCVFAQRQAVEEANLMRAGYFPLALAVRDVVAKQDTYNTQLNHITSARNPADIRVWFDFALGVGRPRLFAGARDAVSRAFLEQSSDESRRIGRELSMPVDGLSSATRAPGDHWITVGTDRAPLQGLPQGEYHLVIEVAREVGGCEILRIPFQWPVRSAENLKVS